MLSQEAKDTRKTITRLLGNSSVINASNTTKNKGKLSFTTDIGESPEVYDLLLC